VRQTVIVPTTPAGMGAVHEALARFWGMVNPPPSAADPSWDAEFSTAVGEIAANIIRHAHDGETTPLNQTLCFRLTSGVDWVEAHFVDGGLPYSAVAPSTTIPDDGAGGLDLEIDDLSEGGRGLALAQAALDLLIYRRTSDGQNHWWLVKRRPNPGDSAIRALAQSPSD